LLPFSTFLLLSFWHFANNILRESYHHHRSHKIIVRHNATASHGSWGPSSFALAIFL